MKTIAILGFYEPFSSWSHLLAAFCALIGIFFLMYRGRGNVTRQISLLVFSVCLIFLFSMSGVFHWLDDPSTARMVLQRLDHAGIWALIAGTFTPIHIIVFRGHWRWIPLTMIWVLAITGLVLQMIFFTSFPEILSLSLFLGLGWFGFFSMLKFKSLYQDKSIWLLIAGGLFYSIGAIIDYCKWPILWPGFIEQHELFHIFVILAAGSHWYFIYRWSDHPVVNEITFLVQVLPNSHYIANAENDNIRVESKSLDELKKLIQVAVRKRFHHSVKPTMRLRYFNEEFF